MGKILVVVAATVAVLFSGCSQRCVDCSVGNMYSEADYVKNMCPDGVETLVYLDQCNDCGFPVTQRKYSNCKVEE